MCITAQDPKEIINILKSKLKVKGDGPLTYLIIIKIQMEQWYLNQRSILRN